MDDQYGKSVIKFRNQVQETQYYKHISCENENQVNIVTQIEIDTYANHNLISKGGIYLLTSLLRFTFKKKFAKYFFF